MRWPLRNQVFLPFAALLTASIFGVALVSAWHAAEQTEQQKLQHLRSIAAALGDANFPLTSPVVQRIAGMVGGQVVFVDNRSAVRNATVARPEALVRKLASVAGVGTPTELVWQNEAWLVTAIDRRPAVGGGRLWILIPQTQFSATRWDTIVLPLAVAAITLALALMIAMLVARKLGRRMQRLPELFNSLADGQFQSVSVEGKDDEVRDLLLSANLLSQELARMQTELLRAERLQLLGQLSGGLAHQLRNAITGARMGIQLHRKHCSSDPDGMLKTAMAQLQLTEEQVRAVLSLKPEAAASGRRQTVDLVAMVREVELLLGPQCRHWRTQLDMESTASASEVSLRNPSAIKGAILNLLLNAVEAAGVGGQVRVLVSASAAPQGQTVIDIRDNGAGFPNELTLDSVEAFQTTKPDGIGLGLTIAQHAVSNEDGKIEIGREGQWTSVTVRLPGRDADSRKDSE